jgi:Flp pilus assembly pilin Flp
MACALLKDESGQSTTEYVLLLLFVVIAVKSVGKGLQTKLQGLMDAAFNKTTEAVNSE